MSDFYPDRDEVLWGSPLDVLLPSSIAIPVTEEPTPTLETVRFSVQLTYRGDVQSRHHAMWPTDGYHTEVEHRHGGRQMLLLRRWATILVRSCTIDMTLHVPNELWDDPAGPILDYTGRWWMAPVSFDLDAPFHPSTRGDFYMLGAVNFVGHLPVW